MEVNKKCDVFSFEVLTLEIIMGKHPGDLISSLSSQHLQLDVLDQRLSLPVNQAAQKCSPLQRLQLHACTPSHNLAQQCNKFPRTFNWETTFPKYITPITLGELVK
ncbi:putative leucine-rich repeat receptor-like protein kinase [Quercus suber]|uniref:non-specific serine/threonine protein kinase n=1 Tax=Quercus suber TaxID=58331 RepID=A0AAW0JLX8_QUESU